MPLIGQEACFGETLELPLAVLADKGRARGAGQLPLAAARGQPPGAGGPGPPGISRGGRGGGPRPFSAAKRRPISGRAASGSYLLAVLIAIFRG